MNVVVRHRSQRRRRGLRRLRLSASCPLCVLAGSQGARRISRVYATFARGDGEALTTVPAASQRRPRLPCR